MSILFYVLALLACAVSAMGGMFYMKIVTERRREIAEREDPRDTKIRDLQAKIKLIGDDMRRDRDTAAAAEDHIRLAHERIVELLDERKLLKRSLANQESLKDDSREELDLLRDKLALANRQLDTLRQRNQELEVELSVQNEPDMLEELDTGQQAGDEDEEDGEIFESTISDSSPSLIHSLTEEIDRWKRHCQVLGGELKTQRERVTDTETQSGEAPEIDELTDIRGIGTTLARKLHKLGIYSFEDLLNIDAETKARARDLIPDLERRMARDSWLEQARLLQAGKLRQNFDPAAIPAHR